MAKKCPHCGGRGWLWSQSLLTAEQDEKKPCPFCTKEKKMPESDTPKIRPLNGNVLLKRQEALETTKGGIVIPDAAKEKPCWAEVMAVAEDADPAIEPGMVVLFPKFGGTDIIFNEEEFNIIDSAELLAAQE